MKKAKVYEVSTRKGGGIVVATSIEDAKRTVEANRHGYRFDRSGWFKVETASIKYEISAYQDESGDFNGVTVVDELGQEYYVVVVSDIAENVLMAQSKMRESKVEHNEDELVITYDLLQEHGEKIDSTLEGTCFLYKYNNTEYVVLQDNSVITREEDDKMGDPIFPS